MVGHPAIVHENQTDSCLHSQNATAKNTQTAGGKMPRMHHHQIWRHLHLERDQSQLVTLREFKVPKTTECHLDMCIWILLCPALNFTILMHMPRIASAIKILIQICWLIKEHPLLSKLYGVWWCSWDSCCRWQQPIKQTWQWRQALSTRNGIFEFYYYL